MQLRDFECPNCGSIEMEAGPDQRLSCLYCGSTFGEVTRICPECGHYNEEGVRHCAECGTQIVRDCPVCGADNWARADHCVQCGRNLDLIERMARRWQETTQERLDERRRAVATLKEREERASQARMSEFLAAEQARQEALARARAAQRERDRRLYLGLLVAIVVFLCVVGLIFLLTSL